MKHLSDVGARFGHAAVVTFWVGSVSRRIPPVTGEHSLLPTSQWRPSKGLPYGWLAIPCVWRSDAVSTFRMII